MAANNVKLPTQDRQQRAMERSKSANVRRRADARRERRVVLWKRWLGGLLLAPVAWITALTLLEMLWRATTRLAIWRTEEFIFFSLGGIAWWGAWLAGWRPARAYVLGHELSHLLVARAFGGRILDWGYAAEGGFVETTKSNTWISLAPYLLPFYSVAMLMIAGVCGLAWDLQQPVHVQAWAFHVTFKPVWLFHAALGLTWCFHATYTVKTIIAEQSDLKRNGEFFSMMLIFLINAALLVALFLAASPAPGLGLAEVWRCWKGTAESLLGLLLQFPA